MVAERALRPSESRCDASANCELSFSDQGMMAFYWIRDGFDLPIGHQRRKHQLGHVFREGSNRRDCHRRRTAKKNSHRQRLPSLFRFKIMKATAFPDLPVYTGFIGVEALDPIHAKIRLA